MNDRKWFVVDADGKTLGRIATRIATVLRGKHTPNYTPSSDMGDFVVVINAEKVHLTGNKLSQKVYYHHSGYMGGLKSIAIEKLMKEKPEEVIKRAVWGMLPKGPFSVGPCSRSLKVYAGGRPTRIRRRTPQPMALIVTSEHFYKIGEILMAEEVYSAVGRRKSSVARVRLLSRCRRDQGEQEGDEGVTSRGRRSRALVKSSRSC